jgi:hypothetical protein
LLGVRGSEFVVIVGIRGEGPAQVRFTQDHDMVQALSPDRADQHFDTTILVTAAQLVDPDPRGSKTSRYGKAI